MWFYSGRKNFFKEYFSKKLSIVYFFKTYPPHKNKKTKIMKEKKVEQLLSKMISAGVYECDDEEDKVFVRFKVLGHINDKEIENTISRIYKLKRGVVELSDLEVDNSILEEIKKLLNKLYPDLDVSKEEILNILKQMISERVFSNKNCIKRMTCLFWL